MAEEKTEDLLTILQNKEDLLHILKSISHSLQKMHINIKEIKDCVVDEPIKPLFQRKND